MSDSERVQDGVWVGNGGVTLDTPGESMLYMLKVRPSVRFSGAPTGGSSVVPPDVASRT